MIAERPAVRQSIRRFACAFGCIIAAASNVAAWGPEGHAIVATLAERQLSASARHVVTVLLGGQTLASVASWADEVRDEGRRETARWHYVRIPRDARGYNATRDCVALPEGDCVIAALRRFTLTVADSRRMASERTEALKFIVHLIGDLHQPLHVGLAGDRGGNEIEVRLFGRPTNLHQVWDTGLITHARLRTGIYVNRLASMGVDSGGTPVSWAEEAHALAVNRAYVVPANRRLGQRYYDANIPVVDRQLARAGARLARVLNENLVR
jgi:hypothetical protein